MAHALAHERSYERQEAARKSRIQQFLTNVSISQRARRDPVAAAAVLAAAGSEYLPAAAQAAALENVAAAAAAPGGSSGGAAHLVYVVTPEVILPQALPASEAAATAAAAASVLPLSSPPQMEPLTGSGGRDRAPSNAQLHPADTPTSVCDGVCDAPAPCEPEASREGPSAGCETAVATSNSPEDLQAAGEEASAESVRDGDPTSSSSNNNGSGGGGDAHLPAAKRPRLQTSAASEAREVAAARAAAAEQYRKQLEHARAAELRRRKQYESDVMAIESALRMQAARLAAAHRAQRLLRRCMSAWEQSVGRSRAAAEACDARWSRKLAKRALLGLKTTMWRAVWRRVTAEAVALGRAKAHHAARLQLAALGWLWTWSRASRMGRAVRQRPALEALRSAAQARAEAMQLAAAHHRAATLAVLVQAWRGAAAAEAQAREQKEQQRLQWAARLHSGRLLRCVLTAWWRQAQDGRLERQQRAAQEQTWSKINGWLDELRQQRGEDYLTPAAALRELTLDDLAPAPPVAAGAALGASRRSGASALADFDLGEPLKALDLPPLSFGGPTSLVFSAAAEAKSAAASKARTAPSTAIPTAAAGNSIFDAVSDFGLDIMKPWSLDERRELASESQPAAASVAVAASLAAALSPGPVLPLAAGKSSSRRSTAESDDVAAAQFKDQQPLLPSRASFSSVDGGCLGSKAPGGSLGTPLQVGGSNSISSDAAAASAARQQALSRFLDAKLQQHQGLRPLN